MKVLQVLDQGFRTTVEEQDDTILWLAQSMRGVGADLEVLLSGHAVHYAVQSKRQPGISVGDWRQSEPADITRDIARLTDKGVPVYVLLEDLEARGLAELPVRPGVEVVDYTCLAGLYDRVEQVWHW